MQRWLPWPTFLHSPAQFILLGNAGGITVYGQSSATLGRSLQDSKEMAALEVGGEAGGGVGQRTYCA